MVSHNLLLLDKFNLFTYDIWGVLINFDFLESTSKFTELLGYIINYFCYNNLLNCGLKINALLM